MKRAPTAELPLLASREYRLMLAWSAAAHVALAIGLSLSPSFRSTARPPQPVFVSLVAAAPGPVAPERRLRQPVDEIVIRPRPKPKPKAKPKAAPKPEPRPEPPAAAQLARQPSLEDIMAGLERRATARQPSDQARQARAARGGIRDSERASYERKVQARVQLNWVGARSCGLRLLFPSFDVRVATSGHVRSVALRRSSGDPYCDDSAERAIFKSQPLPPRPARLPELIRLSFIQE